MATLNGKKAQVVVTFSRYNSMAKPEKINPVNYVLYETRPFLIFFIATYSLLYPQNQVMLIAGLTLLLASVLIVRLRLKHRGYIPW